MYVHLLFIFSIYVLYLIIRNSRLNFEQRTLSDDYKNMITSLLDMNIRTISDSRLKIHNTSKLKDEKTDNEELLCCICRENKVQLMTVPCNHICLCFKCHRHMKSLKCPMCNTKIDNCSRIYI